MVVIKISDRNEALTAMAKLGFNLSDLADEVEISTAYLSQILNGRRSTSAKTAFRIAEELGLEMEEIFSIEPNKLRETVI